jgi:integrase
MATNQMTQIKNGLTQNKTSGKWYANFRFRGKLIRESLKTTDRIIARNKLADLRKTLEGGKVAKGDDSTVKAMAPKFISSISNMSESEQVRSKGYMKLFVQEFGPNNPRSIKPMEIQDWLNDLREEREFGEDSYNKYVGCFKDFYAYLIKNNLASENPLKDFDFLKPKAARKYTPTTNEVLAVIEQVRNTPTLRFGKEYYIASEESGDFIEFMALTGQGRAEVEHLIWQDVLWDAKRLNFYRQKTRATAHTMPLFPAVRTLLEKRCKASPQDLKGRVFRIKNCLDTIIEACQALGITKLGHHSFRRYFITQRLMEGVPPNIVAKWVGHSTSEMVMEIYSSVPTTFEESFANNIPAFTAKHGI